MLRSIAKDFVEYFFMKKLRKEVEDLKDQIETLEDRLEDRKTLIIEQPLPSNWFLDKFFPKTWDDTKCLICNQDEPCTEMHTVL